MNIWRRVNEKSHNLDFCVQSLQEVHSAKIKTKEMKFKKGKSMVKTNTNNHLDINKQAK
jgi:hypothetical protein